MLIATLALAACTAPGLRDLEATLAAQDSATAALGNWCTARGLADPPAVTARRLTGPSLPLPVADAALLEARGEQTGFRHVRLICGSVTLSEAYNWYVPARLTPAMNAALDTSDVPFGKVAAPLRFTRQRLSSQRGRAKGCPGGTVLSHRALLRLPDGRPLALVLECYSAAALGTGAGAGTDVRSGAPLSIR